MPYFFDIHCHLFNLSHPDFISFIKRIKLDKYLFIFSFPLIGPILTTFFYTSKKKKILNTLSFMDKEISESLKILMNKDILPLFENGLAIENENYKEIIITPLMIDFGQKYTVPDNSEIWYESSSHKAIKNQVIDLFEGIKEFYSDKSQEKNIYIFPFLGLNTKNYNLEDILDENGEIKTVGIKSLLKKYFGKTKIENRLKNLIKKLGTFTKIEKLGNYSFAGIKLYPPHGFDPWPEEETEREKVKYLYRYCVEKNIPIISHCGKGGFQTIDEKRCEIIGSPTRWQEVLKEFPTLKLNLAHFSKSLKNKRKDLVSLMIEYPNVYTDTSYICLQEKDYENLEKEIIKITGKGENFEKVCEKILFGSDFSINLIDIESYKKYIENFIKTKAFRDRKTLLVNKNPQKFLFD